MWVEILRYGDEGFEVCVLDVVVFLEVGWDSVINEVWVMFVLENEVLLCILLWDGII